MDDIKQLVKDAAVGMRSVQAIQQKYDEVGWRMSHPEFRKFRHIAIHLSKYVGLLSEMAEQWEHAAYDQGIGEAGVDIQSKSKEISLVVGSLIYHSSQLASLAGEDLGSTYASRLATNAKRFAPETDFVNLLTLYQASQS
ncbi:MAG: hypothetical protein ACT4P0_05035 [Panacagrimonas sp.]